MRHLLVLTSALVTLLSGCPVSSDPTDTGPGGADAPVVRMDAPGMMGTDAPGADVPFVLPDVPGPMPSDVPGMMGSDTPITLVDSGPSGVACGTETCSGTQICCIGFGGGMASMMCSEPADCMGFPLSCDGPEDCTAPGEVCCGMRTPSGGSTACVAEADCGFGRLCRAETDCPMGNMCCPFMGVNICLRRCFP